MTSAEARAEIERLTDWQVDPALTTGDVDRLLVIATVADHFGSRSGAVAWQAATAYTLDALVTPTVANGYQYRAVFAGTSAATQPSWPLAVDTELTDGTVIWRNVGTVWLPTYDVNRAVRDGWLLKAAKTTSRVNVNADGQALSLSDIHEHCLAMAKQYRAKARGRSLAVM